MTGVIFFPNATVVAALSEKTAAAWQERYGHGMVLDDEPQTVVKNIMNAFGYTTGIYGVDQYGEWVSLS